MMTRRGQLRRLRNLAGNALGGYDLPPVTMTALHYYNATFRLKTPSGGQFVLRINRPGFHNATEIRSEIAWISAI
jgi:Ser/Thr protein kinase RdoA (MazF antagonist)